MIMLNKTPEIIFLIDSINLAMLFKICLIICLTGMFYMLSCKVRIMEELRGFEEWAQTEKKIWTIIFVSCFVCLVTSLAFMIQVEGVYDQTTFE